MRRPLAALLLAAAAAADYAANLAYRSPSRRHPQLGIALPKVAKRATAAAVDPAGVGFTHGVASGDPRADSVVLWTRVAPTADNDRSNVTVSGTTRLYDHDNARFVAVSTAPVCVDWTVAADEGLARAVSSGRVFTSSDVDWTVKVEAGGLEPFQVYFYQFAVCDSNNTSPVGRTKTVPAPDDDTDREIKLAVYSCSNFPFGFFNAYGNPVRKDSVDYVIHLGDYIYEYENGAYGDGTPIDRVPLPLKEIESLYDYRKRIATYRTDQDLLLSHQKFAWFPVWDDHEVADNTWKAGSSEMNNTESSFEEAGNVAFDARKANAVRAYFEWMPIRQVDMDDGLRIWRTIQIGNLLDLIMLDTRQYDRSITDLYWNTDYITNIANDTSRSLMGPRQESWFYNQLIESSTRATWRLVGSQVVFFHQSPSVSSGMRDSWNGYMANRNRTLDTLARHQINNTLFLSGDSHANWAADIAYLDTLPYDSATGAGALAVEFAGTAVSSPSPVGVNVTKAEADALAQALVALDPELQWSELYYRGYYELRVARAQVHAAYFGMPTILDRNPLEVPIASFDVASGANHITRAPGGKVGGGVAAGGALRGGRLSANVTAVDTQDGSSSTCGHAVSLDPAMRSALFQRVAALVTDRGLLALVRRLLGLAR